MSDKETLTDLCLDDGSKELVWGHDPSRHRSTTSMGLFYNVKHVINARVTQSILKCKYVSKERKNKKGEEGEKRIIRKKRTLAILYQSSLRYIPFVP